MTQRRDGDVVRSDVNGAMMLCSMDKIPVTEEEGAGAGLWTLCGLNNELKR